MTRKKLSRRFTIKRTLNSRPLTWPDEKPTTIRIECLRKPDKRIFRYLDVPLRHLDRGMLERKDERKSPLHSLESLNLLWRVWQTALRNGFGTHRARRLSVIANHCSDATAGPRNGFVGENCTDGHARDRQKKDDQRR